MGSRETANLPMKKEAGNQGISPGLGMGKRFASWSAGVRKNRDPGKAVQPGGTGQTVNER